MKKILTNGEKWKVSFKINLGIYLILLFTFGILLSLRPFGLFLIMGLLPATIFSTFSSIGTRLMFHENKLYKKSAMLLGMLSLLLYSLPFFVIEISEYDSYHIFLLIGLLFVFYSIIGLIIDLLIYFYIKKRYKL